MASPSLRQIVIGACLLGAAVGLAAMLALDLFIPSLLIAGVFSLGIGWLTARRFERPVDDIRRGAERFAQGDLSTPLAVPRIQEFADVAAALNEMAATLDTRVHTAVQQRNEQEAVLSSMVEGVLAIDPSQRLISLNRAAAQLIRVHPADAIGKPLHRLIDNAELLAFVIDSLGSERPREGEIELGNRILQTHGTALRDAQGGRIGAVVVLNDVTRLRRLEQVRQDFVANVSHELRTPITSIKGFVETLMDGALDDSEAARRFLGIVMKQADRLDAIVNDLLALSRLEQGEKQAGIDARKTLVKDMIAAAVQSCELKAAEKSIVIVADCPPQVNAVCNRSLLEQAIINLVDNAIKYSDNGSSIQIRGGETANEVFIAVKDDGCGIPQDSQPRLFERFFRVDKGRSRQLGGTGLGLAIVKHVVNAHAGRVTVESELNKGSTFTIHLPALGANAEDSLGVGKEDSPQG